jgi:hypothetical protein
LGAELALHFLFQRKGKGEPDFLIVFVFIEIIGRQLFYVGED